MADRKGTSKEITFSRPAYLSLSDIAYNALLEAIINQDFRPGAPISIDNLAKQLDMSNTPVREALMRAHGERLVTQKTNRGFVVTEILTSEEIQQLFETRHLLEIHALSVANITPESIQVVSDLVSRMAASGDGMIYDAFRDFMALDRQFHRALVTLANNKFLLGAWDDLHVHLHLSRLYTGVGLFDRSDSMKEHQEIVETLRKGAKPEAVGLLSHHIRRVEKRMQSFLEALERTRKQDGGSKR
jgi:DNA-binding GntR family transcriptional regulator